MSIYDLVLNDDKFEIAIQKRIDNMNGSHWFYIKYNTDEWGFINPLNKIWNLRIDLRYEYVNKKIDEKYKMELRRIMS